MRVLVIGALLVLGAQETQDKRIAALVERLGSDELEAREQASRDLLAIGVGALPDLEKRLAEMAEGETRSRVKTIVDRLRRLAKVAEISPTVRRVSVSAKDSALRSVLSDVGRQAGVTVECAEGVGGLPVTIDVKNEPALQALDRICAARGDVTFALAPGKVKVSAGAPGKMPTAYLDGFRLRLRKRHVLDSGEFGKSRTDVVLHAAFDAQPDQKFKSVVLLQGSTATSPAGGSLKVKSTADAPIGTWINTGAKTVTFLDEVMVILEEDDPLELVLFLKDVPADLKSFESLRVKARYRFVAGFIPATMKLTGSRRAVNLGDTPYTIHLSGSTMYLYTSPRPGHRAPPLLPDLIDMDSLVVVDGAGKENKLTLQPAKGNRSMQCQFAAERELKDEEMTLKYNLLDAVDREVEFELKNVPLRD